jgi:hypothetical protein
MGKRDLRRRAVVIDLTTKQFVADDRPCEGDVISISAPGRDRGRLSRRGTPEPTGHFGTILGWADQFRACGCTNADLGGRSEFSGGHRPVRTEHMFPRRPPPSCSA